MQMVSGNRGNQFRQYDGQNVGNQVVQNAIQNPGVQNVGNQNRAIVVLGIANQNGNGNAVAAQAEGNANGNNGNQIRCYNYRGLGHLARNYTVRPRRRDAAYLQTQLLIVQKEEEGIQLQAEEFDLMAAAADLDEIKEVNANCILMANMQQASTSGTQSNMAPVYDSDGSAKVHDYNNCYNNEIFNMFTQEEQYTELLKPIPEPYQIPQNESNVISKVFSVEQEAAKFVRDFQSLENEADESLAKYRERLRVSQGKVMMCKQAEQGVPLQAEQADWLEDTDEEIDEQELEAHYSYMAKIQEVSPEESSSTGQPLEKVDQNAVECVMPFHMLAPNAATYNGRTNFATSKICPEREEYNDLLKNEKVRVESK
ncbi:hypothetical protein Tco_0006116 [Tanacetum coccineum]